MAPAVLDGADVMFVQIQNLSSQSGKLRRRAASIILTVVFLVVSLDILPVLGAVQIGNEATVPLASSARFLLSHGFAPDNGSVQELNPPLFTWVYTPNPYRITTDIEPHVFRFQLTTNGNFSNLYWDITTSNNLHNFLRPITNADGTPWLGSNFWRIIYYNANATVIQATSSIGHFRLSATATNWNRSILADQTYMLSKLGTHPHMWWNAENSNAVWRHMVITNPSSIAPIVGDWAAKEDYVQTIVTNSWWNNASVFTNIPAAYIKAQEILFVSLVYSLTTNNTVKTNLAAHNPAAMLDLYARYWMNDRQVLPLGGLDRMPAYPLNSGVHHAFAVAYDILYNEMTPLQRSNCVEMMERCVKFYWNEDWWFAASNYAWDTNRVYDYNKRQMMFWSGAKQADGHSREDCGAGLMFCLAAYGESAELRDKFQYFANFMIARQDAQRMDEGSYRDQSIFLAARNWSTVRTLAFTLPEAEIARSPIPYYAAEHFAYFEPVGFQAWGDRWGDLPDGLNNGPGHGLYRSSFNLQRWDSVAGYTRSGAIAQQYNRMCEWFGRGLEGGLDDMGSDFYYRTNGMTFSNFVNTYYFNPRDGWAISSSLPPNDWGAFTNCVRFETCARPGSGRGEHSGCGDGAVFLSAYGAVLSQSGAGYYKRHPMYHSGMVFVNGIGIQVPTGDPVDDWSARFIAFTNTPDFTYVASDTTRAYNRSNFVTGGYNYNDAYPFYNFSTNKVPQLASMKRHILFPHKRYLVLYDEMTATTNSSFQWMWRVLESGATLSTNSNGIVYKFTATNHYGMGSVTCLVQSVISPSLIAATNVVNRYQTWTGMACSNAFYNPFTRECLTNQPDWYGQPVPSSIVWMYNKTPTTNWHFMTVVYPVKWGESAPTITRLDDFTVHVQSATDDDIISFDANTKHPATIIVSLSGPASVRLTSPGGIRIVTNMTVQAAPPLRTTGTPN